MSNTYILLSNGRFVSTDELYHHGILGMKWGVRRYQNSDGTLTAAGRKRAAQRRSDDIVIEKGTQLNNVGSKANLKLRGSVKASINPLVQLTAPVATAVGTLATGNPAIGFAAGAATTVIPTKRSDNEKKTFCISRR